MNENDWFEIRLVKFGDNPSEDVFVCTATTAEACIDRLNEWYVESQERKDK